MGAWHDVVLSAAEPPCPKKFLVLGGGGGGVGFVGGRWHLGWVFFLWMGVPIFYFYGRGDLRYFLAILFVLNVVRPPKRWCFKTIQTILQQKHTPWHETNTQRIPHIYFPVFTRLLIQARHVFAPKWILPTKWETDFLPLLVLTCRRRSTGKNQYW